MGLEKHAESNLKNGYDTNPKRMGQIEVDFLCGVHYAGRSQSYIAHNLSFLRKFLKWAENKQIERIRWPVRTWARPNANWLSDEEAIHARASAEGIERIVVHLELDLGLRRIEVLRLKPSDFKSGREDLVHVLGKGRNGGKPRDVHWHSDTAAELQGYLRLRDVVVAKARAKNLLQPYQTVCLCMSAQGMSMRTRRRPWITSSRGWPIGRGSTSRTTRSEGRVVG